MYCYFPQSVLLQEDCCVKGGNIDIFKVEVRAKLQQFLSTTFNRFYILIWSCMLLENVMARGGTSSIQVRFWIGIRSSQKQDKDEYPHLWHDLNAHCAPHF